MRGFQVPSDTVQYLNVLDDKALMFSAVAHVVVGLLACVCGRRSLVACVCGRRSVVACVWSYVCCSMCVVDSR